jgi:hypothetical protein
MNLAALFSFTPLHSYCPKVPARFSTLFASTILSPCITVCKNLDNLPTTLKNIKRWRIDDTRNLWFTRSAKNRYIEDIVNLVRNESGFLYLDSVKL